MTTTVRMSWSDVRHATLVGLDRYIGARERGLRPGAGQPATDWPAHIEGAWAEFAVALATGHAWPTDHGQPDRGAPDVGPYHVRTSSRDNPSLIIRPNDRDDEPFVLVVSTGLPEFTIVGWIFAGDARRDGWRRAPNGRPAAWFVPGTALVDFDARCLVL